MSIAIKANSKFPDVERTLATWPVPLKNTAIAACQSCDDGLHHIFFQDQLGQLRHISGKNKQYRGGTKSYVLSLASNARWHTPLVAVVSNNNQVYLFYLNSENMIRCIQYDTGDGGVWSTNLKFNQRLLRVHPCSKLTVVKAPESEVQLGEQMRLYYQGADDKIYEETFTPARGWGEGETLFLATPLPGSALAACVLDRGDGKDRAFILFYQDRHTPTVIKSCLKLGDTDWKNGRWKHDGGDEIFPQMSFSVAVARDDLKENYVDLYYLGADSNRITQCSWKVGESEEHVEVFSVASVRPETNIATVIDTQTVVHGAEDESSAIMVQILCQDIYNRLVRFSVDSNDPPPKHIRNVARKIAPGEGYYLISQWQVRLGNSGPNESWVFGQEDQSS